MLLLAGIGFGAAALICALALASLLSRKVAFWPPEGPNSAKQQTRFRWLFRAMFYAVLGATLLQLWQTPPALSVGTLLAGLAVGLGFGGALLSTGWMGWRVAFGDTGPLATSGPFAFSRHPVYVFTWLGMLGWAFFAAPLLIKATLALWSLFYLIAIFLEEPWLVRQHGETYTAYMARTPRFFGWPRQL